MYAEKYQLLFTFFAGYFHQHWKDVYDWKGQEPSFDLVVYFFKSQCSQSEIKLAIQELESFMNQTQYFPEEELRQVLIRGFSSNFRAPGIGLTYRQWLKEILKILKE